MGESRKKNSRKEDSIEAKARKKERRVKKN